MTSRLIVWLVLQLVVLGIVVLRIPLAAQYSDPAEKLALHLLLSVQVVGVAMLFPFLLGDVRSAGQILFTALPFQFAATFLAAREIREVAPAILFVDFWIIALAIWSAALRSDSARAIGVAVATCLTLGGGSLRYLRLEFAPDSPGLAFEVLTPLPTTAAALDHASIRLSFTFLGIIAAFAVVALTLQIHKARAAKHATSYPPDSPHPSAG